MIARVRIGWLLFLAALALRGGWIGYSWYQHGAELKYDDERLHWQLARNLVERGTLVSDDGRYAPRMPAYPLFLAVFAGIPQYGVLAARLAQALLGAATVLVTYRWAGAAFGGRAALIAGALVCVDPFAIFFSNLLLTEPLFTFCAMGLTAAAWRIAATTPRVGTAPIAAFVAGAALAAMTRPEAVGLVVLVAIATRVFATNRRASQAAILLTGAAILAAMVPWGIRNRLVIGDFAWLSTNGGVTLYDAQGPQADGSSNQAFLESMPHLRAMGEAARDARLRRLALEQVARDPLNVLRLAGIKFARTWSVVPNVAEYRDWPTAIVSAVYTTGLIVGALIGLVAAVRGSPAEELHRTRGRFQALVWLPVIYFTVVSCIFIGSVRYRVPLMPFLALATASCFCAPAGPARRPEADLE